MMKTKFGFKGGRIVRFKEEQVETFSEFSDELVFKILETKGNADATYKLLEEEFPGYFPHWSDVIDKFVIQASEGNFLRSTTAIEGRIFRESNPLTFRKEEIQEKIDNILEDSESLSFDEAIEAKRHIKEAWPYLVKKQVESYDYDGVDKTLAYELQEYLGEITSALRRKLDEEILPIEAYLDFPIESNEFFQGDYFFELNSFSGDSKARDTFDPQYPVGDEPPSKMREEYEDDAFEKFNAAYVEIYNLIEDALESFYDLLYVRSVEEYDDQKDAAYSYSRELENHNLGLGDEFSEVMSVLNKVFKVIKKGTE